MSLFSKVKYANWAASNNLLLFLPAVGGAAAILASLPLAIHAAIKMNKGQLSEDDSRINKYRRSREISKLQDLFYKEYGVPLELLQRKKKDFHQTKSHVNFLDDSINIAQYGHPSIAAHELGHAANMQQGRKSLLGKVLQLGTNAAYSPLGLIPTGMLFGGMATGMPEIVLGGLAGEAARQGLVLTEEGRATNKALKAMQKIKGAPLEKKDVELLRAGYRSYLANALAHSGVGSFIAPMTIHISQVQ